MNNNFDNNIIWNKYIMIRLNNIFISKNKIKFLRINLKQYKNRTEIYLQITKIYNNIPILYINNIFNVRFVPFLLKLNE